MSKIVQTIYEVFPESKFYVHSSMGRYEITSRIDQDICAIIYISTDEIFIDKLYKCEINGKSSLKRVEKLALKLPKIKRIRFLDASSIMFCNNTLELRLPMIYILSKGRSWYNSLDYFSDNYEEEKRHNRELIKLPIAEFLKMCSSEESLDGIQYFSSDANISTKEFFSIVHKEMKKKEDECSEKWNWVCDILNEIRGSGIIQYNPYLKKNIINVLPSSRAKTKRFKSLSISRSSRSTRSTRSTRNDGKYWFTRSTR